MTEPLTLATVSPSKSFTATERPRPTVLLMPRDTPPVTLTILSLLSASTPTLFSALTVLALTIAETLFVSELVLTLPAAFTLLPLPPTPTATLYILSPDVALTSTSFALSVVFSTLALTLLFRSMVLTARPAESLLSSLTFTVTASALETILLSAKAFTSTSDFCWVSVKVVPTSSAMFCLF